MNNTALAFMLISEIIITFFTGYFFYKVLFTKPKKEPDSYSENDDDPR